MKGGRRTGSAFDWFSHQSTSWEGIVPAWPSGWKMFDGLSQRQNRYRRFPLSPCTGKPEICTLFSHQPGYGMTDPDMETEQSKAVYEELWWRDAFSLKMPLIHALFICLSISTHNGSQDTGSYLMGSLKGGQGVSCGYRNPGTTRNFYLRGLMARLLTLQIISPTAFFPDPIKIFGLYRQNCQFSGYF
jgi:hypothetical protein